MDQLFGHEMTQVEHWLMAGGIFVAWSLVWWMVEKIILGRMKSLASKTSWQFDDLVVKALPAPLNALILVTGLMVAVEFTPITEGQVAVVHKVLMVGLLVAGVYFVDQLLQGFLADLETRRETVKHAHVFLSAILHIVIWSLGFLMVLSSMGISITPILASLGVGSLAVALALQSTLSNLFSGFYLLLDKPVKVGDFIRLDSGEEGYVEAIGWRSTRIRLLPNQILVIPNSKLAEEKIVNYDAPDPEVAVTVQVGVHYDSDLDRVERVTVETARDIQRTVPGAVENHEPNIRFHTFDASSINFAVNLRARRFTDGFLIKHEFIKALRKRYQVENITIPYPTRTVEMAPPPKAAKRKAVKHK